MEIRLGLERNPGLRVRPPVEEFLDAITILPLDSEVARAHGRVRAQLEKDGRPIGPLDTMIAAHAIPIGAALVTSDLGELRRVRGLRVADWTK